MPSIIHQPQKLAMIRFRCPSCDKSLSIGEDKVGRIAICPSCKINVIVPKPHPLAGAVLREPPLQLGLTKAAHALADLTPPPQAPEARGAGDPTPPPVVLREPPLQLGQAQAAYALALPAEAPLVAVADDSAELAAPNLPIAEVPPESADEPESTEENTRRRRIKRKKRVRSPQRTRKDYFGVVLIAVLGLALPFVGLSLIFPKVALAAAVLGAMISLAGIIWFLVSAFRDDINEGWVCLLVPPYCVLYLFSHFDKVRRPAVFIVAGIFIAALAAGAAAIAKP